MNAFTGNNPLRLALIGAVALGTSHAAIVNTPTPGTPITILNGGFDIGTYGKSSWAGTYGGTNTGWTSGYFAGGFPTDAYFANSFGSAITQQTAETFVAGYTYYLSVDIFTSTSGSYYNAPIWTIGLTADGATPSNSYFDQWYNSGTYSGNSLIPSDHIITANGTNTGITQVIFRYTATANDAGKTIGVALGSTDGATVSKYDPSITHGSNWYGFMDNVTLTFAAVPEPGTYGLIGAGVSVAVAFVRRRRQKSA